MSDGGELGRALVGVERRLIVYGSLAPGRANHHELGGLSGTWSKGWITGTLHPTGWGAALGFPVLCWHPEGDRVSAHLFESDDLPDAWERLDAFEGPEYLRIPVPFLRERGDPVVGQVYAARPGSSLP